MLRNLDTDLLRSFVAVADSRSFTRAGGALGRTQSAVSMQVKRLEEALQRRLFEHNSRNIALTADGELLLGYARRMLRLNDEVVAHFAEPDLAGLVRVGTPDDYATYLLPPVLSQFARTYPQVRVEVSTDNGLDLLPVLAEGGLDLALVTRHPQMTGGQLIRREQLMWVGSRSHAAQEEDPLPLALYPQGCVCRDLALQALDKADRRWRIAYASRSITVLQSAVADGFAVSVMEESTISSGLQVLGEAEGLPPLPAVEIALHRAPGSLSAPVQRLAEHISQSLGEVTRAATA